ncbi:hypothetical protein [Embleya sp. NPDC059237]|uniref:hypothetical protein n=1 Tax=Embleya sp. NPDC059237 TaxID=3346784 RepID=UPI0036B3428F
MRYSFTPDCRPHGPLAALAVLGFPTMATLRRPLVVEPRRRLDEHSEESVPAVHETGRRIDFRPPPVTMDFAHPCECGCGQVWGSDGMSYSWDMAVAITQLEAHTAGDGKCRVRTFDEESYNWVGPAVWDDLRGPQEVLAFGPDTWGGPPR